MGKRRRPWQDAHYVLGFFGERLSEARRNLNAHVRKWSAKGRRHELTGGGGLVRSAGGWRAVKEAYRAGIRLASDERILGSSEFFDATLKNAGEIYEHRMQIQSAGINLSAVIAAACRYLNIEEMELARLTIRVEIARARALITFVATQNLSISGSEVVRRFNVDRSAISRAALRVSRDPELLSATKKIQREFEFKKNQQLNNVPIILLSPDVCILFPYPCHSVFFPDLGAGYSIPQGNIRRSDFFLVITADA